MIEKSGVKKNNKIPPSLRDWPKQMSSKTLTERCTIVKIHSLSLD